jgi:hypothetical protein
MYRDEVCFCYLLISKASDIELTIEKSGKTIMKKDQPGAKSYYPTLDRLDAGWLEVYGPSDILRPRRLHTGCSRNQGGS